MDMTALLIHLGYVALFIGTFLEGETVVLLAAFLAHRGYLNLYLVIAVAAAGTILGDQCFYWIGRKRGPAFLKRRLTWRRRMWRARILIQRHELLIILIFRFLYGLRTVTPFALGMAGTRPRLFVPLNFVAGVVWAVAIGVLGYLLGELAANILGKAREVEAFCIGAIVLAGIVLWIVRLAIARRKKGPGEGNRHERDSGIGNRDSGGEE